MGIFKKLWNKITGHATEVAPPAPVPSAPPATPEPPPAAAPPSVTGPPSGPVLVTTDAPPLPDVGPPPPAAAPAEVDVTAILNDLAAKNPEKLDWKKSIVDLLKLVDMDSSLSARKELAKELGYDGDMSDSASMNIWLHKQVIKKLAENGGKVPSDLLD